MGSAEGKRLGRGKVMCVEVEIGAENTAEENILGLTREAFCKKLL